MDRRFLSQPDVIAASRNFVCVRMMTYENAAEAQVLQSLWRPDAPLENTVFAFLDPYGHPLTRGTRSPAWFFQDSREMAQGMNQLSAQYQHRDSNQALPVISNVRLGMNVSACDKRPIAIVVSDSEQERRALEERLAPVAWSQDIEGRLVYASGRSSDIRGVSGVNISSGYLFVSTDEFGTGGQLIQELNAGASPSSLYRAACVTISEHRPMQLEHRDHIRLGHQNGITWQTAIPVTDPHELHAEQFGRGRSAFPPPPRPGQGRYNED